MTAHRNTTFDVSLQHANGSSQPQSPNEIPEWYYAPVPAAYLPSGSKSLSGIAFRSSLLGFVFSASLSATLYLATNSIPFWRAPLFLAFLALFHYLEFQITAAYNPSVANISSFLFSQNGAAYNVAHGAAFSECIITNLLIPRESKYWLQNSLGEHSSIASLVIGLALVIIGQTVRSVAMKQAGENFNHTVQVKRKDGHELVTDGIYSVLRHPSYFGFFWWGLGTQVVLGNKFCFMGYAVVLWKFFKDRVLKEESLLIKFFGDRYVDYQRRTWVGIPFI
ncbi:hypothetical protein MMC25_004268 [Agyrium rufum]|nr:hypothetical protein [Agyrium rufum]